MFWQKKTPAAPPTAAALKEFQAVARKEVRAALREVEKQRFTAERALKEAQRDLEKKIKEKAARPVLQLYAKNALMAQKGRERQLVGRARLQALEANIGHMLANLRMGDVMQQSAKVIADANQLANLPEFAQTMQRLQGEMDKQGIVSEMIEEALAAVDEDGDVDKEADRLIEEVAQRMQGVGQTAAPNRATSSLDAQIKNLLE